MTLLAWVVLVWLALQLPLAMLIGKMIRLSNGEDYQDDHHSQCCEQSNDLTYQLSAPSLPRRRELRINLIKNSLHQ